MKFKKLLGFFVLLLCVSVEADDCPMKIDPPAVVVKYGDPVSVNCTVFTEHVGMGWVAKQNPVPNQPGVQFLLWTVENLTVWDINPQCFANFKGVPQCLRKVSVTVYNTPDSVSIRSENHTGPLVEGYQYKLVCEVQNVAPVQNLTVKWYKGTEVVNITLHPGESKTPVNVSSTLLITPNRTDDGAQYKCVAELQLGSEREWSPPAVESEAFSITVHYSPVISKGGENVTMAQGEMVFLSCRVQGNPSPHVQWVSPSGNVNHSTVKNNSIAIKVSADSPGVYTCTASNHLGNATKIFSVTVNSPSSHSLTTTALPKDTPDSVSIRFENHTGPLVEGRQYRLVCEVQNVAPVQNLTVKWYKGTEVVNITLYPGESKTPVNVSSTLLITPNRTDDGAQYKCVAELQLGSEREWSPPAVESEALSFPVHYPPVISEGDKNVIVDQGSMVSLNCTVQGNPSPLFQWTSPSGNVDFLTPKKNNSIISADSSGVYTCSASNYLGSTTRTVSITVVKKDYTIFAVIPVAILFLLIAFILFLMKRKRQYGNYSVSKRHSEHTVNPNSIPMQCLISNGAHQSLQKSTADTEDQD
uniref:Ig-like domain-containing protein n=1 Tax=Scleropages formosus TaxID=113540 RepID=A0A8C9TGX2_SCLFO